MFGECCNFIDQKFKNQLCGLFTSCTLEGGDAQIMKVHNHLLLTLKCGSEQYEFNLFELPAAERRKEIEYLLFKLSSQLLFTQKQLKGPHFTVLSLHCTELIIPTLRTHTYMYAHTSSEVQDHLQEVLKVGL